MSNNNQAVFKAALHALVLFLHYDNALWKLFAMLITEFVKICSRKKQDRNARNQIKFLKQLLN